MSLKIIADSGCDMPLTEALKKDVRIMPLTIRIDDVEYRDGVTITTEEFYNKMESAAQLPTTSQVTPYAFEDAYREELKTHDELLVITLSGKLSGTYQSAVAAADECEGNIYIVDSENVSVGTQILMDYAVTLRDGGMGAKEIAEKLNEVKKNICTLALVDTLEYLYKGGRLSRTTSIVGGLLQIKPVLSVVDGVLAMLGKARGSRQSNNLLNETIKKRGGIDFTMPYLLAYSGNDDALLLGYIENSRDIWADTTPELPVRVVGSAIGTHTGPGLIAVSFFTQGI